SRGSSHQPVLHFGIGEHASAAVTIIWPDGEVEFIPELAGGAYHLRHHPSGHDLFADRFSSQPD
ncbi:MAG: ASPIC/UnbV domain-containing protein, partial [Wenzhouxiangella sp.]